MTIEDAIKAALDGRALLFTGSGFSIGAKNVLGNDLPSAKALASKLGEKCGLDTDEGSLGDVAEYARENIGDDALIKFLTDEFTVSETTEHQRTIASVPWLRMYTTNYDTIIEDCAAKGVNSRALRGVTLCDAPSDYADRQSIVVHLNGQISDLTARTLDSAFRLTDASYLNDDFRHSRWKDIFTNDLRTCDAIFFVGFSMSYDLDIARIINQEALIRKSFFIVHDKISVLEKSRLEKFGQVLPIKADGLAQEISSVDQSSTKEKQDFRILRCFEKISCQMDPTEVTDLQFYDLLAAGNTDRSLLNTEMARGGTNSYCILTSKIKEAFDAVKDGARRMLITSDLGNGKSVFMELLALRLAQGGYDTYMLTECGNTLASELQWLNQAHPHAVILADDAHNATELLEWMDCNISDLTFILSERNYIYDFTGDRLEEILGDYRHINIDRLAQNDVKSLVQLFDKYKLWGSDIGNSPQDYEAFIHRKCHDSLREVVVARLPHSAVGRRFLNLVERMKGQPQAYLDLFIMTLINKVGGLGLRYDDFVDILGGDIFNQRKFRQDPLVAEFLDIKHSDFAIKSSLLAQHLLRQNLAAKEVIDTIITLGRMIEPKCSGNRRMHRTFKELMTYRAIDRCINTRKQANRQEVFRVYESFKSLPYCQNNIQFWLQFAIAHLSAAHDDGRHYQIAENYFKHCYDLADKQPGYSKFKIDNHYCRFLIDNEITNGVADTCMTAFNIAHDRLMQPKPESDNPDYLFKVAKLYAPFHEKFYGLLSAPEQRQLENAIGDILKLCNQ